MMLKRAFAAALGALAVLVLLPAGSARARQAVAARDDSRVPLSHAGHVDLCCGRYVREDEDVAIEGPPPFTFTRTYLSGYHVAKEFGIGATNNAEWYLVGDSEKVQWAELILPSGNRIRFARTSPGTSYSGSRFLHRSATEFNGATLEFTRDAHWLLRFKDGAQALFRHCTPQGHDRCAIEELRDPKGETVWFDRNADGVVTMIQAQKQAILLAYDDKKRITRATVNGGDRVDYSYDGSGRLIRAAGTDGTVRAYTYGPHDELLTIREPGRYIQNTYDANLRVVRQDSDRTSPSGETRRFTLGFAYTVQNGAVVETDITEYDGSHTRMQFNTDRRVTREIRSAESAEPVTMSIGRHPVTGAATSLTVECTVRGRRVTQTASIAGQNEYSARDRLIEDVCDPDKRR
jgi:YD repeat-containing protein